MKPREKKLLLRMLPATHDILSVPKSEEDFFKANLHLVNALKQLDDVFENLEKDGIRPQVVIVLSIIKKEIDSIVKSEKFQKKTKEASDKQLALKGKLDKAIKKYKEEEAINEGNKFLAWGLTKAEMENLELKVDDREKELALQKEKNFYYQNVVALQNKIKKIQERVRSLDRTALATFDESEAEIVSPKGDVFYYHDIESSPADPKLDSKRADSDDLSVSEESEFSGKVEETLSLFKSTCKKDTKAISLLRACHDKLTSKDKRDLGDNYAIEFLEGVISQYSDGIAPLDAIWKANMKKMMGTGHTHTVTGSVRKKGGGLFSKKPPSRFPEPEGTQMVIDEYQLALQSKPFRALAKELNEKHIIQLGEISRKGVRGVHLVSK